MLATSSPSFGVKFRHPVLLAAVIGIAIVAGTIWMFSTHSWWKTSAGPFLEFELAT
jgi:hypothetical protein